MGFQTPREFPSIQEILVWWKARMHHESRGTEHQKGEQVIRNPAESRDLKGTTNSEGLQVAQAKQQVHRVT